MSATTLTIIGFGPRGLTFLDRVVEAYRGLGISRPLEIHAVDPREPGQGVHNQRQSDHLIINTIGGMVTMFPHAEIQGAPPRPQGPSLPEWARLAGYRRFPSGYFVAGKDAGEEITDHDYLPRRLLGEYLTWYYDRIVGSLPSGVSVTHHRHRALDLEPLQNDRHSVVLETGFRIESDFVFLATGHGTSRASPREREFEAFAQANGHRNSRLQFIRNPYPTDKLEQISSDAVVAIQGLGLTVYDIISELTVGRGGSFVSNGEGLAYRTSGREPRLKVFGRSGLPFTGRGVHQKKRGRLYRPSFFTKEAVLAKRAEKLAGQGTEQLDFDEDVLPLLIWEMAYVYRSTKEGLWPRSNNYVASVEDLRAVESLIRPLRGQSFSNMDEYRIFFQRYLEEDLLHAERGNVEGPEKAAIEVIRDSRQALRLAIEHRGLTPESHRRFLEHHTPALNRITFGPPARRNYELMALLDAGVVDLAGGPGSVASTDPVRFRFLIESRFGANSTRTEADVLIVGRIDTFHPLSDLSPFYQNLLRRGLIRPHCNGEYCPGGLDIDRENHPISRDGKPLPKVWAVGYPVEGPNYYTYALPLPGAASQQILDADRCVIKLFEMLKTARAPGRRSTTERLAARAAVNE